MTLLTLNLTLKLKFRLITREKEIISTNLHSTCDLRLHFTCDFTNPKFEYQNSIKLDPTSSFSSEQLENAKNYNIAIITTKWNQLVIDAMKKGAIEILQNHFHVKNITEKQCSGSFELPFAAKSLALSKNYNAMIVLGSLIKGKTPHTLVISNACANHIMNVGLETGTPIIFGVLTDLTQEEALERAGLLHDGHNLGKDYAVAAIEMAAYNFNK